MSPDPLLTGGVWGQDYRSIRIMTVFIGLDFEGVPWEDDISVQTGWHMALPKFIPQNLFHLRKTT